MNKAIRTKFKRKCLEIIGRNIPYNTFYRPRNIYFTSKDFVSAVAENEKSSACIDVYPNVISTLTISEEFYDAILDIFKPSLKVKTTYLVTCIENGRIFTDHKTSIAVISQDNHLIADVSFSYNYGKVVKPEDNTVFSQKFFREPVKYKGVVFSMLAGLGAVHNYGHWLIDALPRIHLLKKSGLFDKVDWFLVPNYEHDFQKDSLRRLGIDAAKIIRGDKQLHIQADLIIASTAPRGIDSIMPVWPCQFLRDTFLTQQTLQSHYPPLIYITRKDSKIRNVADEDQVIALLKGYGFVPFTLSRLHFIQKVKLFASAQVIVSAAGAAMTNLIFCKKGTKVLELFGKGFVHAESYDKANKVGLDYNYILGKYGKEPKKSLLKQRFDVVIDLNVLKVMIENILTAYEQEHTQEQQL